MRLFPSFLTAGLLLSAAVVQSSAMAPLHSPEQAWLFTSFRGDGDGLHLAYSHDGLDWTDLGRVFLKPDVGSKLMRDPHLFRGPDGRYHLVWTTGWGDKGIGYASSDDLETWSAQRYLPVMERVSGTRNCWAPEVVYLEDRKEYMIFWSSSVETSGAGAPFRAYYTLTKDFATFSEPKQLFDPGFDNIDATLLKRDGRWLLFFKETDDQPKGIWGAIRVAEASDPLGPYTLRPEPVFAKERVEGPAPVAVGDQVLVYADYYVNHKYGVRTTTDLRTWSEAKGDIAVVDGQRHGSILTVSPSLVETLRAKSAAVAPPPALQGAFTADPAIRVFGDTYYIYPTADRPYWNTTQFTVWSSKNLVEWKSEGVILDITKDLTWANNKAWAPDCIERDGRYYFYFCANHNIGVAVSDKPTGPFRDALGHPLIEDAKIKTFSIDPHVLIDDDGQAYLYFGNGIPTVYKLKRDMVTLDGPPVEFSLKEFREGIVVFKRQGKYYFMWSIDDARSPNYRVGWGISDSPFGPVVSPEKNFIVLRKNGAAQGTAHHSIVNVPGTDRWYVAYHRHAVPGGGGYKRETCLVRMEFDASGAILPMDPMVPAFKPGDVGEPVLSLP